MFEPGILLSIGLALIGGVAWAVRVEGRVNGHDDLFDEREKQLNERHADIQQRLNRIEAKVDEIRENQPA